MINHRPIVADFGVALSVVVFSCGLVLADPAPVQWDTVQSHANMFDIYFEPEGECVALVVSNHGEMGYAGLGAVNLDFLESGLECGTRTEDAIYLYSGSPFVIMADDASGTNARLTSSYAQIDQSKAYSWTPVDDLGGMTSGLAVGGEYDSVYTGRFVNPDVTIAMERTYYAPRDNPEYSSFVVTETKLYSADGQAHDHVTVGSLCDWNIPSETPDLNVSSHSQRARVVAIGTDDTFTACQPYNARMAAEVFGGSYTFADLTGDACYNDSGGFYGMAASSQRLAADTNLARDGTSLDPPQPDAAAWWDDLGTWQGASWDQNPGDQAVWLTYMYDHSLQSDDTVYVWTVLVTVLDGSGWTLDCSVRYAKAWYSHVVRGCQGTCCDGRVGNINARGGDEPTISDVVSLISSQFLLVQTDDLRMCLEEADINGSGGDYVISYKDLTIGDICVLIDYLFITGPSIGLRECIW